MTLTRHPQFDETNSFHYCTKAMLRHSREDDMTENVNKSSNRMNLDYFSYTSESRNKGVTTVRALLFSFDAMPTSLPNSS
mmetsp:Transcript_26557/g.41193  ORF Transcript_26557/g.41193 Transcript_26557/m.41193 type:complete len:80 (+) Transcript_26557:239-478(+)